MRRSLSSVLVPGHPSLGRLLVNTSCTRAVANPSSFLLLHYVPPFSMASTSSSVSTTVTATKTPSPSCPHTSGYSKGATAGIGIGSGLAGALLALLVGFLLLKTRRSVPDLLRLDSTVPPRRERGGGGRAGAGADSLPAVLTRLEDHLPQAITHAELASAAASLEAAIGNYLDNYIDWVGSPPASLLDNDRLRELAGGSGADWKQKLLDRDTRYAALRMFIARFLVARTDAKGTPGSTILPSEILQTYQAVVDGQTFGKRQFCSDFFLSLFLSATFLSATIILRHSVDCTGY